MGRERRKRKERTQGGKKWNDKRTLEINGENKEMRSEQRRKYKERRGKGAESKKMR